MLTDYYGIVKEYIKQLLKTGIFIFGVKITSVFEDNITLMLTERIKCGTNYLLTQGEQ